MKDRTRLSVVSAILVLLLSKFLKSTVKSVFFKDLVKGEVLILGNEVEFKDWPDDTELSAAQLEKMRIFFRLPFSTLSMSYMMCDT